MVNGEWLFVLFGQIAFYYAFSHLLCAILMIRGPQHNDVLL